MRLGRLLLRATVGAFFVGHGAQKLFGAFGGHGLKATADGFESMGLKPGNVHATAAGAAETLGGAGILLGYQTPLAASAIIGTMATAINRVHLKNGPWAADGGYEYNAVLIGAAATLAEVGPGPLSLDALRGKERSGAAWSLFALVAGALGAVGVHFFAESRNPGIEAYPTAAAPAAEPAPASPAPEATEEYAGDSEPAADHESPLGD